MSDPTPDVYKAKPKSASGGWPTTRFRPICPEDEPMMARLHAGLSAENVYCRYFNVMQLSSRIAHERLSRVCHPNVLNESVIVAESPASDACRHEIVGVGRLSKLPDVNTAEVALLVGEAYQGRRVGTELMRRLIEIANDRGWSRLVAHILPSNLPMQRICTSFGMRLSRCPGGGEVKAELDLRCDTVGVAVPDPSAASNKNHR